MKSFCKKMFFTKNISLKNLYDLFLIERGKKVTMEDLFYSYSEWTREWMILWNASKY
jgi:hypothetical protein